MNLTIDFKDEQEIYEIRVAMKAVIRKAVFNTLLYENFDKNAEVSVTFTDNEGIKALNSQYRNKDTSTDVLSFPMFNSVEEMEYLDTVPLGDIVISLEKAKEQAHNFFHGSYHELAFLSIHSTLHLLGYDHETSKEDEEDMFKRQKEIMEIIGF